jgi:hypothetical protein
MRDVPFSSTLLILIFNVTHYLLGSEVEKGAVMV